MKRFLPLILIAIILSGCSLGGVPKKDNDKITIATTIPALTSIVQQVAGDDFEVVGILPPGASPHTFEVSVSTLRKLSNVDVVFAIGNGIDNWIDNIINNIPDARVMIIGDALELIEFVHDDEGGRIHGDLEYDPHYWLSLLNAKGMADHIGNILIDLDNSMEAKVLANVNQFKDEVVEIYTKYQREFSQLENRNVIYFHDSWNYLSAEFNLNTIGVFEASPGKEPTPQYLATLFKAARESNVTSVFSEPQLSPDVIRPFVNDLGLTLEVIDPLGGVEGRVTYQEMMTYNLETILNTFK